MKKVIPVQGDIIYDNLGIEKNQLDQICEEVNISMNIFSSDTIIRVFPVVWVT